MTMMTTSRGEGGLGLLPPPSADGWR
jgi:hypothetical protein